MKKTLIILPLAALCFNACGPSKAEVEAELRLKIMQDSIANAAFQAKQEELKQQLIDLKAQLAAFQSKLEAAQNESTGLFDGALGGRSEDDKAKDIAEQTKNVETLKQQISDLEKQIQ